MIEITVPNTLCADPQLRELLLSYFLESLTGTELATWLKDIGQDSRGTVAERRARIRAHTKYLTMPAAGFPQQTKAYLTPYSAGHLADLCTQLGVSDAGNKDALYRRIMREVHYREGWLQRVESSPMGHLTATHVMPFLGWMPINKRSDYEKDYYPILYHELQEVFGANVVYEQLPIAHGSILKIDFHVGDPQSHGVGIEVKLPKNNADIQRLLGQLDQYQRRYGENLLLFVLIDFLKPEVVHLMQEELTRKSVRTVCR
jgi:hypothetical protein